MVWYPVITLVTILRYFYYKRTLPVSWLVLRKANLIEKYVYPLGCCHAAHYLQYGSDVIMVTLYNDVIQALNIEGYAFR